MAVGNPLVSFGVCQAVFSDLTDPSIKGSAKILGDINPDVVQELIDLRGGCAAYPWGSAPGEASGEISIMIKQYDKNILRFINSFIVGSQVEDADGEPDGSVTGLANVVGTSVFDATTGIASVAVDTATKTTLAYGDYIAKAVDATTFDLYVDTDISGLAPYVDDTLKINATPITLPGTSATVIYQGIEFTGGSGSIALVADDQVKFSVRPVSNYLLQDFLGKEGASPQEFSLMIAAEKIGNKIRTVRFPKCIAGGGGNLKMIYKDWSTIETTIKILQDPVLGYAGLQEFVNR